MTTQDRTTSDLPSKVEVSSIAGSDDVRVSGLSLDQVMSSLSDGDHHTVTRVGTDAERETDHPVLSARESEVLRLIAMGKSNDAVAAELYLSTNTIKSHIRTAYRKIGAESRSQAVLWAVQHGVVGTPDA